MKLPTTRHSGRTVAGINGVVALVMLVVLAAVALVARPSAPPSIAEFAPRAEQQLDEAPEEQTADAGSGGRAQTQTTVVVEEGAAPVVAPGTRTETVVEAGVPSALNCVRWPDGSVTQTSDPQSPPCIPSWDVAAGNGGATARGVTANEILVGIPTWDEEAVGEFDSLLDHFNTRFQLYGRKLRAVALTDGISANSPAEMEALAQQAAELGVFGSLDISPGTGNDNAALFSLYLEMLSDLGIVGVGGKPMQLTDDRRAAHPLVWTFSPPFDEILRNAAALVCRSVASGTVRETSEFAGMARTFAVLVPTTAGNSNVPFARIDPLTDALTACGATPVVVEMDARRTDASAQTALRQQFLDLKTRGLTTLISLHVGHNTALSLMPAAAQVGYTPEWLIVGSMNDNSHGLWQGAPTNQTASLFGMATWNRPLGVTREFWYQANPEGGGYQNSSNEALIYPDTAYYELLLLASGIQMAGPELTPASFASGLARTTFPNPGAAGPPYWQATVGFDGGGRAMTDDFGLVWWSHSAHDEQYAGRGAFCYVDGGARWSLPSWPDRPHPFFDAGTSYCP